MLKTTEKAETKIEENYIIFEWMYKMLCTAIQCHGHICYTYITQYKHVEAYKACGTSIISKIKTLRALFTTPFFPSEALWNQQTRLMAA